MRPTRALGRLLADRLGLAPVAKHLLDHPIPEENAGGKGWMYVLGASTLVAFLVQLVTGAALATMYVPSPTHAWESLRVINEETTLGPVLRGLHFYGASAMVILIFLHMARVFLTGSYKYPREATWISGGFLLGLVLAMAATGQLLRWDQDGIWSVIVWAKFAERTPLVGPYIAQFFLAGETVGGATLTRFFAFHVFIFPGLIILLVIAHLYLVVHHGISEPPRAGHPVEPSTYRRWYQALLERGRPYWPYGVWREAVAGAAVVAMVLALALLLGPKGPGAPPDATEVRAVPKPDWFFLWYYTLVWLKPPALERLIMVYFPLGVGVVLFLIPLFWNTGERHPGRRPWAVATVGVTVLVWATLTAFGVFPYWVPDFETRPLPAEAVPGTDPVVHAGAQIFFERGCQYCHAVREYGGEYGPDLTRVAKRLSPEEITVRIVNGIRNMPAYRGTLSIAELDAVVAFLRALGEEG